MLSYVNPLQLSKVWHIVKPGIEEILDDLNKDLEQELWTPEDVYTSIKTSESILWMSDEGFLVSQVQTDRYTGTKKFFMWIGYSFSPTSDIIITNISQVEGIAKHLGCEIILFNTSRDGFRKVSKTFGYSKGVTTYSKRI